MKDKSFLNELRGYLIYAKVGETVVLNILTLTEWHLNDVILKSI